MRTLLLMPRSRRHRLLLLACLIAICAALPSLAGAASLGPGPYQLLSPGGFWNTHRLGTAPIDRSSRRIVLKLTALFRSEELMKNGPWINSSEDGAAIFTVAGVSE